LASNAEPITDTVSPRRDSHVAGNSTWVLEQPAQLAAEADAAQCLPACGKTANERDPTVAAPHRTKDTPAHR